MTADSMPQQKIALNLQTAELEQPKDPFVVALPSGKTVTFGDPKELDWQELADLDNPFTFIALLCSEEDKKVLREEKLSGRQFNKIMEAFQIHFGIGTPGNARGPRF